MEIISDTTSSTRAVTSKTNAAPSGLNLKSIIALLISKWYWFVLSLAVTLTVGTLYILKTTPLYTRSASIMIKDDSKGGSSSTSVDMSELGIATAKVNLENEINTLKSPSLMANVVDRLNLNDTYNIKEGLRHNQIYKQSPVIFSSADSLDNFGVSFKFKAMPDNNVKIYDILDDGKEIPGTVETTFGDTIKLGSHKFAVIKPEWDGSAYLDKELNYSHSSVKWMAKGLAAALAAVVRSEKSSIIDISITRPTIGEADDILSTVIQVYNERWVEEKNQIAVSTSRFIDERLGVIESELGIVDSDISSYKSEHQMPDIGASASMYMSQSANAQAQIAELSNQISVAELIRRQLNAETLDQTLPTNTGLINADIVSLIGQYNTMVIERNRLLETSSESNPVIKDRAQTLRTLKSTMMASIDSYIGTLRLQMSNLRQQQSVVTSKISSAPNQQKYLLSVERQQKVKESLYLFLLQKREENELSQAFTAYNTSTIGEPDGLSIPTFPSRTNIMLIAFALGLAIPALTLMLREMLDTKIRGRRDLAALSIPYVGEIPSAVHKPRGLARLKKAKSVQSTIVVEEASRNSINEAFRVLRTNLEYLGETDSQTPGNGDTHNATVIAVTSANAGSGKTFISANLGKVLAIKGKKTLLIDLDIRKASLSKLIGHPETGITEYLISKADAGEIIHADAADTAGLDVIAVGTVPPNPSELLSSHRLDQIIHMMKSEYDYIILDCPPVEIVTDAKIINRVADITLFIVRAGLLEKDELPDIQEYYDRKRYKNMAILLNGTDIHSGYGYHRYGYHYGYHYGSNGYYATDKTRR